MAVTRAVQRSLLAHPSILATAVTIVSRREGCHVAWRQTGGHFVVRKGNIEVLIARSHAAYLPDLVNNFAMMTEGLCPDRREGRSVYDFRVPALHELLDGSPWSFPGLPEVDATSDHYIDTLGIRAGDVVWDIGAYSGMSTLAFARAVGGDGHVIAVEADPANFACLEQNLHPAAHAAIELIHAALWSDSGTVEFQSEANQGSTVACAGRRSTNLVEVQALTPVELFERSGLERLDAVKMDIEGGEYNVVPAFAPLLAIVRPVFVIEVHKDADGRVDSRTLIEFFDAHGYRTEPIRQPERGPFPLLLAVPR